ncbi:MAG TPA: adenylate/guanylate cyclase domain-containing protein [Acidimicrobiales bacterium]|nr:adenylate/guanylate cyclase domain-containing protein [Acidimicrobiales bacterium]
MTGQAPTAHLRIIRDVRAAVRSRLLLANVAGGSVVLAYGQIAVGRSLAPDVGLLASIGAFAGTFVVSAVLANVWAYMGFSRSIAWVVEGREPTDDERAEVLKLPWQSALRPLLFWIVGAALYAAVAPTLGGASALSVMKLVNGIVLGGVVTCTLGFLLIERSFTQLFALALAGEPPPRPATLGVRMRLMLAWAAGSSVPLLAFVLDATVPSDQRMPRAAVIVLALAGLGAGFLATLAVARSLADPLDGVRDAMGRVRDGDLDLELVVDDGGEIGQVQAGFNNMVDGLRQRERVQDLFHRHVGRDVAVRAMEHGTGLGGEQRDASVVFVDLVGSTAMAEVLPPTEVVATLNDFFDVVVRAVDAQGGWVNKFEGDGALCVFGVPSVQPDHAARALTAARQLHMAMAVLAERHPGLAAGIGVSSGQVVAGNVGTEARYEYTVIGPAVNEAARLTEVAKGRPIKVLASEETVRRAGGGEAARWRDVGTVALRGRTTPTAMREPLPDSARVT